MRLDVSSLSVCLYIRLSVCLSVYAWTDVDEPKTFSLGVNDMY